MDGRLAWILQESPTLIVPAYLAFCTDIGPDITFSTANMFLLGLFIIHYIHRTLVFPLRMKKVKRCPVFIMFLALVFCLCNGYMQCHRLMAGPVIPESRLKEPSFIFGIALFAFGMATNIHSDYTLISLRRADDPGSKYKIPYGGMFTFISGANFFGEILEWAGFAIACGSLEAAAFAIFTASNIGPRAISHHDWYRKKFGKEYPSDRKALIPFLY